MRSNLSTALTFDDGPVPDITLRLLDVLAAHKVVATFFCVGSRASMCRSVVFEAHRQGHEIGTHSWSHKNFLELTEKQLYAELRRAHDCLCDIVGKPPRFMRPPFGAITQHQRELSLQWFNYTTILWNVDSSDWRQPGIPIVSLTIRQALHKGLVVLLHDTHHNTVNAVADALSKIEGPELNFATISTLRAVFASKARKEEPQSEPLPDIDIALP